MKFKHVFASVLVLIVAGSVFFVFYRTKSTDKAKRDTLSPAEMEARLRLHPLASPEKIAEAEQQPVSTWEEWIEARAEIGVARVVLTFPELPTSIENLRKMNLHANRKIVENYQALEIPLPKTAVPPKDYKEKSERAAAQQKQGYQGPQTPEALIAEFGEEYLEMYPKSSAWDEDYPVEDWLQRLLNKGVEFKEFTDYSYYVGLRRNLIRLKDKPEQWQSGGWGIPITNNFETYEAGYIDRKIWEDNIVKSVRSEHPNDPLISVFFPSSHPEKYLPSMGATTFVHIRGGAMSTWGTMLTKEQKDNLRHKGIEPEDIEIIYIDEEYNILPEKPKPYNREAWLKENSYIIEFEGIPLTPENYEKILGEPVPDGWEKWYEREHAVATQGIVSPDTETFRTASQEAARQTQEQFQQGLRELERFANMSDTEFQAELERRFLPQLPELPTAETIENRLWSEAQSARMTPARFEAALKILEQYGPEEGMQRLTEADPKAAAQVKRILGGASAPEQPPEPPTRPKQREGTAPPEPHAP